MGEARISESLFAATHDNVTFPLIKYRIIGLSPDQAPATTFKSEEGVTHV